MTVEYHPSLQGELEEVRDHYNNRTPGLGDQFINEVEATVLRLAANPGRWMVIERDLRRALLKRFPYVIYFRQVASDRIRVTVVKHQRRHPQLGRERE